MGSLALVLRRARAGLGLLSTILLLAAATTAIIAGTLGYSAAAATVAARQALTDAVPTEAGIRVQTRVSDDPAAQDAAARRIIDEAFAGTDVRIQYTTVSEPRTVADHEGRVIALASSSLLADDPEFGERVTVVEGDWPEAATQDGPVPGALHAGAAERWGVSVGDTLTVGEAEVTVTALWRAVDPQAAFWFGDPLVATGGEDSTVGPLVVDPGAITALGGAPFARWTVQPDPDDIQPSDMPTLAAAASKLQDAMKTDEVDVRGVTVEGDLAPTTATAARNLATAQALNVVPVILLLLVSVIAIVQIARLQSQSRSGEIELLIARGASRRQVLGWTLVEALGTTVVATALGTAAALLVMRSVPAGDQQTDTVVRVGILTGISVLLALALVALLQVRTIAARTATDRSGRTRTVAALGTLLFTLGAAALSWWQLRRYGSPLVTADDGSLTTDLVAGAAPALLLAAVAVVAMALLGPIGRIAESLTRPARGLGAHLASAQVSRRLVVYAVPVVLTVLAVGTTTVSAMYAATTAHLRTQLTELAEGADVRASLASGPEDRGGAFRTPASALPSIQEAPGVTAALPVWQARTRLAVGTPESQVLAMPVDRMDGVAHDPEGIDTAALGAALEPADAFADWGALELPQGASEITLDVAVETSLEGDLEEEFEEALRLWREANEAPFASAPPEDVDEVLEEALASYAFWIDATPDAGLTAWIQDVDSGIVVPLTLDPVRYGFDIQRDGVEITSHPEETSGSTTLTLPGTGTQRLLGLTVETEEFGTTYLMDFRITGITSDLDPDTNLLAGAPELGWGDPQLSVEQDPDAGTLGFRGEVGQSFSFRGDVTRRPILMFPSEPTGGTAEDVDGGSGRTLVTPDPVPIAVTESLASASNLEVGSRLTLNAFGVPSDAEVALVVPAVPGTTAPDAVLVDSRTLAQSAMPAQQAMPLPDQVWIASDDPERTVEAVGADPSFASVTGPGTVSVTDAASAVRLVFWVASTGAVLLAFTGIAAVTAALLAARRAEVAVLRALGMTPGGQARSRGAELFGVVGVAGLLGLAAGWLVGAMVIPDLARSTTVAGQAVLPAALRLEAAPWATLLGLLLVAILGLVGALAWQVRRQALDNEYREEIR